jgi:signal transduction histidine kinase/CheY-like chemotaxis protein/AraC-like DNA-binding protein
MVCWLLPIFLPAQAKYQQIETDRCIIKYRLWSEEEGLPHWRINGLFRDSQGHLWVRNYRYLSRFNGNSFVALDTSAVSPYGLGEDIRGYIWQLTKQNIRIFNPHTRESFSFEDYTGADLPLDSVSSSSSSSSSSYPGLYSINQVVYLFVPELGGLWRYDGRWEQVLSGLPARRDTAAQKTICLPGPEQSWWVTDGTQVERVDRQGKRLPVGDALLSEERLLFYAAEQLYTYNPAGVGESLDIRSIASGLPAALDSSSFPLQWRNGESRIGNVHTLRELQMSLFTDQKGAAVLFDHESKERLDLSRMLGLDLEQSPYFRGVIIPPVALGDGVFMLHVPSQRALLQIEILPKYFTSLVGEGSYSSLAFTDAESLLAVEKDVGVRAVGLSTGAVSDIDLEGIIPLGSPFGGIVPDYVYGIQGQAWLGYKRPGGMLGLEAKDRGMPQLMLPATAGVFREVQPLSDSLWLYTSYREMGTLNMLTGKNKPLKKFTGVCPTANSLYQDRRGRKWTGTSNGVYSLEEDRMYLDSLAGNRLWVMHIHESAEGTFWLSTTQGLVRWQPGTEAYELYDQSDGLISKFIYAAYPDTLGRLWLSGDQGITSFDMATQAVVNYTHADGLASNEQLVNAHVREPDGRLYFGSTDGITVFDPNAIPQEVALRLPALTIDRVDQLNYAGAKLPSVYPGGDRSGRMKIDRSCIQTVVQFSHPYFREKALTYAWRIVGTSPQWTDFTGDGPLTISGMPRGDYDLEVRVSEVANPRFYQVYRFRFYKGYYLYQRAWFQVLAVLLLLSLIGIGVRWRLRLLRVRNELLEQEVSARTQELREQKEKLEQLDAAKTQLFNNISHEFRTPLSIIRGQADKIREAFSEAHPVIDDLHQIGHQTEHLTLMLNEVMDLSRLQMGALQPCADLVDWTAFVRRVFAMFDGLARQKQLDYRLELAPAEPTFLWVDVEKTERILVNLIGNALKFTPEVGRILVRSTIQDGQVEVVVSDTGPGIAEQEQELIFERYRQGSAAQGVAQPGYGIGLALSREYTELMDGRLWVESVPGAGASFFLQLPVQAAAPADIQAEQEAEEFTGAVPAPRTFAQVNGQARRGHLLLVEDHPELLAYLQEVLSGEYELSTAANGQQAWEILQEDTSIDLVVSDVMMPLMDGFTLLQQTRNHPDLGYMPFLLLTALASDADRLKALRLGVDSYLTKPFSLEELRVRLANLVGQQWARKGAVKAKVGALEQQGSTAVLSSQDTEDTAPPESYDDKWLCELEAVVREHLEHTYFKVPQMAEKMHVSERTLYTRLKDYTGLSPAEYLRKARLEVARQYLEERKCQTVKEVAYAVGMKDARHFSQLFRKEYGRSIQSYFM